MSETRKRWQMTEHLSTERQKGKTVTKVRRECMRTGTPYRLVETLDGIPRGGVYEMIFRWHLHGETGEVHEVMPYRSLDAAIEQAEAFLRENKLI